RRRRRGCGASRRSPCRLSLSLSCEPPLSEPTSLGVLLGRVAAEADLQPDEHLQPDALPAATGRGPPGRSLERDRASALRLVTAALEQHDLDVPEPARVAATEHQVDAPRPQESVQAKAVAVDDERPAGTANHGLSSSG